VIERAMAMWVAMTHLSRSPTLVPSGEEIQRDSRQRTLIRTVARGVASSPHIRGKLTKQQTLTTALSPPAGTTSQPVSLGR
jgi:hypothetical protein